MQYTPEQLAIRQFLSKPAPYNSACGCMGPQKIDMIENGEKEPENYKVKVNSGENRAKAITTIHTLFQIPLVQAKARLDSGEKFGFEDQSVAWNFKSKMEQAGVSVSDVECSYKKYPLCPCSMNYVSEVEGYFYKIIEHRSPDGITHTAVLLGPIGGPYQNLR